MDSVVGKVVLITGAASGRPLLMLPWSVNLARVLKDILPVRVWDAVGGRMFGIYRSMGDFVGHAGARG